jgi:TRAP-type C4-dicarboxylate transport system permease small subunit
MRCLNRSRRWWRVAILLIGVTPATCCSPLVWTDELAQAVFLWLGMIGATVALNRGEHALTALIVARHRDAAWPEASAAAAGLVFLAAYSNPPSSTSGDTDRDAGLGVPEAWLTAPAVRVRVMIVVGVVRLFRAIPGRTGGRADAVGGCRCGVNPMADPWLQLGNLNLILFFLGVVGAAVLAGVPITPSRGGRHVFPRTVLTADVPMLLFVGRFYEGCRTSSCLAIRCSCSSGC